ncbi:kinase-like protein, partial [Massarina eburnea CBS 473.64]
MTELDLETSLLQRWFPVSPPQQGKSTLSHSERFSETDLRDISDVLRRVGQGAWSRIPRIYAVLRLLDRLDVIDLFLAQAISDVYFPFTVQTLPQSLNPSVAHGFLQAQRVVLSSALDLERETGRHRHFPSSDDVPFIKVEDLGKGAYGYVDRVISTVSHKEYARKLIPRGRTFQRDQKILRDFERELGFLKKLSHHRHIVQLIGSYTDPRFVGIVMSPVAECDLKDFLNNCAADIKGSTKSFTRTFFGCLTSALSYLHDNTIRHKDIKPQNVLVSQHSVYLTDFGISLDWSDIGQSTTTGPTPKTARYCAPEVSEYAPRNTSSDMWSLGCIFLEIWAVLKGETVANLHAFLEANGAKSSCYHLNIEATFEWMKALQSKPTLADNPPYEWICYLLAEDKNKRWTARQLLAEIEAVNSNPEAKFAFSGYCCM